MGDAIKSALWTALWTFVGSVLLLSLGWLADLASWASASGHAPLPGLSTVGYAVLAAALSASSGFVAGLVRALQAKGVIPGTPPTYSAPTTGGNGG